VKTVEECLRDAKMNKSRVHDVVLVGGSSRIPKVQQLLQDFFNGKNLCKSINADEAVAYGAAIQAAMLSEGISNVPPLVLKDVTPFSLGVSTKGDIMSVLIPRNNTIPVTKKRSYWTCTDGQLSIKIKVYEGERAKASGNNLLGSFSISIFPPALRGHPFDITFALNENGILSVSAEDKATGNEKKITITNDKGRLSSAEIDRMIQEARQYKSEDEKFIRKANALNDLDRRVYRIRSALNEEKINSKLSSKEKQDINLTICRATEMLDCLNQQDIGAIGECLKELKTILDRIMAL